MKILIISKEAWRNEENGGNVLTNLFSNFDADFAQIYCTEKEPNNNICKHYYQMTDRMVFNNIFKKTAVGTVKKYKNFPLDTSAGKESFGGVKRLGLESIRVLRDTGWKLAKWKTKKLKDFVQKFNPDIIFAPTYGYHHMLNLTEYVAEITNAPIVSYISDDIYTNRQLSISPIFWIRHFNMRKHIRRVFKLYDFVYTMTDEQKVQCERDFSAKMKILRKGGEFSENLEKKKVNQPIRFVFAGNLYVNRWKTLVSLSETIKKINSNHTYMTLDIYTNTELNKKATEKLNSNGNVKIHSVVPIQTLKEIYRESDIALHVEGFDIKSRNIVRLSFSTKIIDCLDSGCAVMAICDEKQAGLAYLRRNDAAICISNLKNIETVLRKILKNPDILIEYQHKAFALGRKTHNQKKNTQSIKKDFMGLLNQQRRR